MDKKSKLITKSNALITLGALIGIVVMVNVLSTWGFLRHDLTENGVYTLSEDSVEAVRALDELEVRVYISKELPDEIPQGWGQTLSLRGVEQQFLDKLEEYRSNSDGKMKLIRVEEDIEKKAELAKLRLFSADDARVSQGGLLEFTRYALGATFSYKNVTEVFPLAMNPAHYEFEITKILLRLKDKAEKSALMVDVLGTGKELFEAVQACDGAVDKALQADSGDEGLGLGDDPLTRALAKLDAEMPTIKQKCDPLAERLAATQSKLAGRNIDLDRMLGSVEQFVQFYGEFMKPADPNDPQGPRRTLQIADALTQVFDGIDSDHDLLVNSPGRRTIGFVCGHQEFCPFASHEPLIPQQMAAMLAQKNQFLQHFLGQVAQLEQEVGGINDSIRRGLFTMRGFDIRRVDLEQGVDEDIDALVVFGPRKAFDDRAFWELDQFLLSGRPVVVLLNNFDVAVRNMDKDGNLTETRIDPTTSNIDVLLRTYGVTPRRDLVVEPERNAPIVLTELVRQGQLVFQSERRFAYPLLPTFTDLDQKHPLVRGMANLTLPYASTLDASAAKQAGREVAELIRSSDEAVVKGADVELLPPNLVESLAAEEEGAGAEKSAESREPYTVAVYVSGTFDSHFKGKDMPAGAEPEGADATADEKKDELPGGDEELEKAKRLDSGAGRLLVIGSTLGLENLSAERIFEGFDVAKIASGDFDFLEDAGKYGVRFQNWRMRIQQLSAVLEDSVRFLPNVMDWAVQNEALLGIRSKGFIKRPLIQMDESEERLLRYAGILAAPILFLGFGAIRRQLRRRRKPTL